MMKTCDNRFIITINTDSLADRVRTVCGLIFLAYTVIQLPYVLDYWLSFFAAEHFFSTAAYDHVRPFVFCGYYALRLLANGFSAFVLLLPTGRTASLSAISLLAMSFLGEVIYYSLNFYIDYNRIIDYGYTWESWWSIHMTAGILCGLSLFACCLMLIRWIRKPEYVSAGKRKYLAMGLLLALALVSSLLSPSFWSHSQYLNLSPEAVSFVWHFNNVTRVARNVALFFVVFLIGENHVQVPSPEQIETRLRSMVQTYKQEDLVNYVLESLNSFLGKALRADRGRKPLALLPTLGNVHLAMRILGLIYHFPSDKCDPETFFSNEPASRSILALMYMVSKQNVDWEQFTDVSLHVRSFGERRLTSEEIIRYEIRSLNRLEQRLERPGTKNRQN